MDRFENVTAIKKANVYFNGGVTSRTVLLQDGTRKTLGIVMPGEYEFGTADEEHMEVLGGTIKALLPGSSEWVAYAEGESFTIPASSSFKILVEQVADYCCSYIKK